MTEDEADAMATSCDEPKCWALAGGYCKTPSGTKRRPHPARVKKAGRLGLLGGLGRAWMCAHLAAIEQGRTVTVAGTTMILPPQLEAASGAG